MRFFKAFNLLHRRTKSDTFVSGSTLESATTDSEPPRRPSVPVSLFDLVTSQIPDNFKHFSDRGSGVTLPVFENTLVEANDRWAKEYAKLQCQLKECREELHNERQKVHCLQRKLEEDNRTILDLRMSVGRFEGLLNVSDHTATGLSQDQLQSTMSGGTEMLLNTSVPNLVKGSFANVMNVRTMDEYSSALQMTLATRKELRDQKKMALFWKRKALESNQLQSLITPSVSTISSIHDPLPVDRQIALDALVFRRGLDSTLGVQIGWKNALSPSGPPKTLIPKTYQLADEVGDPIAIGQPPSMSSEHSRSSRLGPLASESIKAEISSLFGSPDSVKHLIPRQQRESSHSPSLIGKLTKFTFSTLTPSKKTESTVDVESFGDLHAIFSTTFGVDRLLVDDMEDDLMTSVLSPPTSVSVSPGPRTGSICKTSNIPTRKRIITYADSNNEVTLNTLKQASKDCTSHRTWQSYRARPATSTKGTEGSMPLKRPPRSPKPGRGKENSFAKGIPIFQRKTLSNSTQNNR